MDHLRAGPQKYDVIASHPLGRKEWADAWVDGFKEHGYHVSVAYVTTHEANSLLGVVDRYQRDRDSKGYGRWLDPRSHDEYYDAIPNVAHHLESEGRVDSLFVVNRDGRVLYANHRDPETGEMRSPLGAREAILAERNRPPTPEESEDFERKVAHLRDERLRRNGKPEELPHIVDQAELRHAQRPAPSPAHDAEPLSIGDALRSEEGRKEPSARSGTEASPEVPLPRRRVESESENSGSSSGGERLAPSSTGNGSGPHPAPDAPPRSDTAPARPAPGPSSEAATENHVDARRGGQEDIPSEPPKPARARAGDEPAGGSVPEEDPRQRIARSSERLRADRAEHRESAMRTRSAADQRIRHERAEEERRRGTERPGPSERDERDHGPET
ncbi:hypothetical protein GCM10027440_38160 [Nocardiopsis coralliicola]